MDPRSPSEDLSNLPSSQQSNSGGTATLPEENVPYQQILHLYNPEAMGNFANLNVQLLCGQAGGPASVQDDSGGNAGIHTGSQPEAQQATLSPSTANPPQAMTWEEKGLQYPGAGTLDFGPGEGSSSHTSNWRDDFLANCKCNITSKEKRHWSKHCPSNTNRDEREECDICHEMITRLDLMKRHKKDIHAVEEAD